VPLIPLEEARQHVFERCAPVAPVRMAPAEARGLVLAEWIQSTELIPPFDNTAVDGFAVRAADTEDAPVTLEVVDTVTAGRAPTRAVGPGEAIRIMTGAPMPDGADAVVMVENTSVDGDRVVIESPVGIGDAVRRAGDDVQPGDNVLITGAELGPAQIGILASLGVTEVLVSPRLRVGVLSTGDELVVGPAELQPGQIRDSNRPALLAAVAEAGCEPVDLGCIPDDEQAIEAAFREGAATCDAILSSGGVSMGDVDLVKVVLDRIGDMRWMQIAIKPAKPFAFGVLRGAAGADGEARTVPVFGLPGNPVSSLVSFELLARPALRTMAGHPDPERLVVQAVADEPFERRPDGKVHFARVVVEHDAGGFRARPAAGQGSHQLASMARANGLAVLLDGPGAAAGDPVHVILLR
jgi:molybdenum cofactor synthesis domain-containing protein